MDTVNEFLTWLNERYPDLGKSLGRLDADGRARLGTVLARFDTDRSGRLGSAERTRARDVLRLLRDPTAPLLTSLEQVLGYLDVNAATALDARETETCVQVLDLAGRSGHRDGLVSASELSRLLEEMRALDANGDGRLDAAERTALIRNLGRGAG